MIVAILVFSALLELALGAGILATAKNSVHEILGVSMIGFGILTFGSAGLLWQLLEARRAAEKDRQIALEERQARAALDLKRRSGMISSIDRQQRRAVNATAPAAVKADAAEAEKADTAEAVRSEAVCPSRNGKTQVDGVLPRLQFGSAQFGRERHWQLLTSCAGVGYIYGPPLPPLNRTSIGLQLTQQLERRRSEHRRFRG